MSSQLEDLDVADQSVLDSELLDEGGNSQIADDLGSNPDSEVGEPAPQKAANNQASIRRRLKEKRRREHLELQVENLKGQLDSLSGSRQPSTPQNAPPVKLTKPTMENCGYDAELFERRRDEYEDQKDALAKAELQQQIDQAFKQRNLQDQQQQLVRNLAQGVEQHNLRAENFILRNEEQGVTLEDYSDAEMLVRETLDDKNKDSSLVDFLVAELGEGSAEVMYHLGTNATKLSEINSLIKNDPTGTGFRAAFELGALARELNPISELNDKISHAPPPATSLRGGNSQGGRSVQQLLQNKLTAAVKKGDQQLARKILREARERKVEISIT